MIALIVIAVIAVSGGGDDDGGEAGDGSGGERVASAGERVELEGTAYEVTRVRTEAALGGEFNRVEADGRFIVVELTLTNLKDEPATIVEDAVRIRGGNDSEYTTDTDAFAIFDNQLVLLEEIQPDLSRDVVAVYDVPPGAVRGAVLEVRDLFSDERAQIDLGLPRSR